MDFLRRLAVIGCYPILLFIWWIILAQFLCTGGNESSGCYYVIPGLESNYIWNLPPFLILLTLAFIL